MMSKIRSPRTFSVACLLLAAAAVPVAVATRAAAPSPESRTDLVRRGEYLVTAVGACNDCHTPWKLGPNGPEPDMTRMLSGHPHDMVLAAPHLVPGPWMTSFSATNTAFAGPWGVSFSANLTPDDSGLGAWTEDIFVRAMRTGKHWGQSRQILPPMPWPAYSRMTDDDLKAIYAYLRTIPAIHNEVPLPIPPEAQADAALGDGAPK